MKQLIAILLTLLVLVSLPVVAMAEDVTAAETSAETSVETSADTSAEDEPKTNFGFFPGTLAETLPIMGMGMLGIFLVTCVIILAVLILSKVGKDKNEE